MQLTGLKRSSNDQISVSGDEEFSQRYVKAKTKPNGAGLRFQNSSSVARNIERLQNFNQVEDVQQNFSPRDRDNF